MTSATVTGTPHEIAVAMLLRKRLGVKVPIKVVDPSKSWLELPTEPEIRVSQRGSARTTGNRYNRVSYLLEAEVRIVGYGADGLDLDSLKVNRGRPQVRPNLQKLPDDLDVLELEYRGLPGGSTSGQRVWAVSLTLSILTPAPPSGGGEYSVTRMGQDIASDMTWRIPGRGPHAGKRGVGAKVKATLVDAGKPNATGIMTRKVRLDVTGWPVNAHGMTFADAHRQITAVLEKIQGRAFAGVGRVFEVNTGPIRNEDSTLRTAVEVKLRARGH